MEISPNPSVQIASPPSDVSPPPKPTHKSIFLLGGLMILFIGLFGGFYLTQSSSKPPVKGCTLEAKICPDGSSVVRSGPNCEFTPCPQNLDNSVSQECGVCGPKGDHNMNGAVCAPGFICKRGLTTSLSYCVMQDASPANCEKSQ